MQLPLVTYLNGLSALVIVLLCLTVALVFFIQYFRLKKPMLPVLALLAFFMGWFYSGTVATFISLLLTGTNIDGYTHCLLTYLHTPIAITLAMYLGFGLFNPSWTRRVLFICGVLTVIWIILLLGWPEEMFSVSNPDPGLLQDVSVRSYAMVLGILFYLGLLVVFGVDFLWLSRRIQDVMLRKKARFLAAGWILIPIGGLLDSLLLLDFIVIARFILFIGMCCVFAGFAPLATMVQKIPPRSP